MPEITARILEKIKKHEKIVIVRHRRPDGDALGASYGLREILRASFPGKTVVCVNSDSSEHLAFMGNEDAPVPEEDYPGYLAVALDTATEDRLANPYFASAGDRIRIDHHVDIRPYCECAWVEERRSSTCEMIAAFRAEFPDELVLNQRAAALLFCGMVTDSGRFRTRDVSGETLRLAGTLLDTGIDTETLFSQLNLDDFEAVAFKAFALGEIKRTGSGVAYLTVTSDVISRFGISQEDASASVSYMENIRGSIIWIAFIDNPDGSIRVRLRSRFVPVNRLAEKYRGGGHECACGATLYERSEIGDLLSDADCLCAEFKSANPNVF
jgi:phosphoesterase RecJ-like protein